MKSATKAFSIVLALCAGAAFAEVEATDPIVIAHKDLMKSFGGAAKTLGGMASGDTAFDAAAAEAAKAKLVSGSADIPAVFEKPGSDPASEAKPEIWTNWDDFVLKAKALGDAATALDASSADGVKAGMGAVGGACKACHTAYRL
ncbi:MAG: cytochrome c [Cypionkella sp.]|uniref:c-type cytochrome n=1 Tax=Cypionkella sp. TaxID=2811411 RepID=UPI00262F531B|nr:cytochrome c [Cypionkella sp.]MDB5658203.1 cytochrome c [Cypionkella sp.]